MLTIEWYLEVPYLNKVIVLRLELPAIQVKIVIPLEHVEV